MEHLLHVRLHRRLGRSKRSIELGRALGALIRDIAQWAGDAEVELQARCGLDALAASNLARYIRQQAESTGTVPSDRCLVVERFRDEFGDWRVCILSPFGGRVHAPWSLAIAQELEARTGVEVQSVWSDDGIVLRFDESGTVPTLEDLFVAPDDVEWEETRRLEEHPLPQVPGGQAHPLQQPQSAGRWSRPPR